jgi:hypothetical protein
MSRMLAAIVAGLMLAGAAFAQGQAPATHAGTKLSFPPTLAGATFVQSTVQPAVGGREPAYSWHYATPNKLQVSVYVYETGRRVPSSSDNPTVVSQFANEIVVAEQSIKSSGMTGFEKPAVPSACRYGTVSFRCIVFSASAPAGGGRLFSKMMLTGYRDYFVKIRVDWAQADGRTVGDADTILQAFVPALLR